MNNKALLLLILSRFLDILTTYIFTPDLKNETSVLVLKFHFDWTMLISTNIILVAVLYLSIQKLYKSLLKKEFQFHLNNLKEYTIKILFKNYNKNKSILYNSFFSKADIKICMFFILKSIVSVIILFSFFVSINNLLEIFNYSIFYNFSLSEIHNFVFIINLFLFMCFFYVHMKNRLSKTIK